MGLWFRQADDASYVESEFQPCETCSKSFNLRESGHGSDPDPVFNLYIIAIMIFRFIFYGLGLREVVNVTCTLQYMFHKK